MCLDKKISTPKKLPKFFWKVFRGKDSLFTIYYGKGAPIPMGVEVKESDYRLSYFSFCYNAISEGSSSEYPYGFHAFFTKKDAKHWADSNLHRIKGIIRKVKLRGIHTIGYQRTRKLNLLTAVATYMTILE